MIEDETQMVLVRENLTKWLAAFNAKDIDVLMSLYDEDSLYANAEAPLLRGVQQIRPWYEQAFELITGRLLYKEEAAMQSGSLAMLIGKYFFSPPAGSPVPDQAQLTGRVSLLYRRDKLGEWRLVFDMDNTPPDVTPADFN